ncbi:MAG: tetratricopeptide repeat protein, partial [Myxococcota bacterium]
FFERASALAPLDDRLVAQWANALWWQGQSLQALARFRDAVLVAARRGSFERIAGYHELMRRVAYIAPEGADAARAKAATIPPAAAASAERVSQKQQAASAKMATDTMEAFQIAESGYEEARNTLGESHPVTLYLANTAADALRAARMHEESRHWYEKAYRGAKNSLGDTHPDALTYRSNLALARQALGDLEGARAELVEIVVNAVAGLGAEHSVTWVYRQNLAMILQALGRNAEASAALEKVWTGRRSLFGAGHPDTLQVHLIYARQLHTQGEPQRALDLFDGGYRLATEFLPGEHPLIMEFLQESAGNRGIEELDTEGLIRFDANVLGDGHPWLVARLRSRGDESKRAGRLEAARDDFELEHAGTNERQGEYSLHRASLESSLADLALITGAYNEAETRFLRGLAILEVTVGRRNARAVSAMSNIAILYEKMGRYADGIGFARRAFDTGVEILPKDHPDLFFYSNNLALLLNAAGQWREAGELYRWTLNGRTRVLGADDPETLRSKFNFALFSRSRGLHGPAETMLREVLEQRTKRFGPDNEETLKTENALALVRFSQGDYSEAQSLYERALKGRSALLGTHHRDTLITLNDLAS